MRVGRLALAAGSAVALVPLLDVLSPTPDLPQLGGWAVPLVLPLSSALGYASRLPDAG